MSPSSPAAHRLYVALDYPSAEAARAMAADLAPLGVGLKVGLELFSAEGPALVRELAKRSPVFLDLKYHDIPGTVAGAVRAASHLGVTLLNIHLAGGEAMVRQAVTARDEAAAARRAPRLPSARGAGAVPEVEDMPARLPRLLGVTVLTSLETADLKALWGPSLAGEAGEHALRLAERARDWGLDGVVASAREAAAIRAACGPDFLIVTPGIRPPGAAAGDQKRVATPAEAVAAGASHLVVGRPVTRAANPMEACQAILAELDAVLA